jgi:hypothetical protein
METIEAIMESTIQYSPIEMALKPFPTTVNTDSESKIQWRTIFIGILGSLIAGGLIYLVLDTMNKNGLLLKAPPLTNTSEKSQKQ